MPLTPINLNHDMNLQLQKAVDQIKSIENTPKPGITFRDITPLLANGQALKTVIDAMATQLAAKNIHPDLIVCPVARGFIFGTALAFVCYLQGVSDLGAINASMLVCIEPVSATLFATLWLKTDLVVQDYMGILLITLMVFFICMPDKKRGK